MSSPFFGTSHNNHRYDPSKHSPSFSWPCMLLHPTSAPLQIRTLRQRSYPPSLMITKKKIQPSDAQETMNQNTHETDDNINQEWIPPSRPLSGDTGSSHLYTTLSSSSSSSHQTKDMKSPLQSQSQAQSQSSWEQWVEEEEIKKYIQQESLHSHRKVEYFDLDQMDLNQIDWKTLLEQTQMPVNHSTNMNIEDEDEDPDENEMDTFFNKDDWENVNMEKEDFDFLHGGEETDPEDSQEKKEIQLDPVLQQLLTQETNNDEDLMKMQLELIGQRLRQLQEEKREQPSQPPQPQLSQQQLTKSQTIKTSGPDWLRTRRMKLQEQDLKQSQSHKETDELQQKHSEKEMEKQSSVIPKPTNLLLPSEARHKRQQDSTLPIIPHTLLSTQEIVSCLTSLGGIDIQVIIPDEQTKPMLGWEGLILVTGTTYAHIQTMAAAIVKNLRLRDLASKGVVGAMYGVEGGDHDPSTRSASGYRRQRTKARNEDGWMIVDCRNYVVHIQDDITRKSINLEGLWSPDKERGKEGRYLRKVSSLSDNQMDDFISRSPIPEEYSNSLMAFSAEMNGLMSNAELMKQKKNSLHSQWTPVIGDGRKNHQRKMKKRSNTSSKSRF